MADPRRQFGPRNLAAWRYAVPGPVGSLAVVGSLPHEHGRSLLETFEELEEYRPGVRADGWLVVPGARVPREAKGHLRSGGWIAQLRPHRRPTPGRSQGFAVLPSLEAPRFLLPRKALAAGLRLYTPSRPLVRYALRLMTRTPLRLGLALLGGQLDVWTGGRHGSGIVAPEHHLAIATGTPSAYHKATLLELDPRGRETAYTKLSSRPLASAVLEVEASRLERLRALGPRHFAFPRLVRRMAWGRETGIVLSPPSRELPPWREGLTRPVVQALTELFQRTRTERRLVDTAFWRELCEWHDRVEPHLPADWRERIASARARALNEAPREPEAVGWAHGDFIDWNLKGTGADLFFFDWEQSTDEAPPFYDLLHWVVFTHHHVRADSRPVTDVLGAGGEFAPAREQLEAAIGVRLGERHLRLYALRTALYHLRTYLPGYEDVRAQHDSALRALALVLDEA